MAKLKKNSGGEKCPHINYDSMVEDTSSQINTWKHCLKCSEDFDHQIAPKIKKPPIEGEG